MAFSLAPAANSFKWRMALTEPLLATGSFYNFGFPAPEAGSPRDHSAQVGRTDGGQALYGYHTIPILFPKLSEAQASALIRFLREARSTSGYLFMTIWTGAGYDENGPRWIDVQGRPHLPEEVPSTRLVGTYGQVAYEPVSFRLVNFTVINDPSAYSD